jgi:putative ABC transport system permease protein
MSALLRDLRFAARMLLKRPGLTTVIVLTLAVGIAGNTVMFSLVDAVLLRPLGYPDPDRLVQIEDVNQLTGQHDLVAPADFMSWREQSLAFEGLAAYFTTGVNLMGTEGPERVLAGVASANYFSVLGTQPAVGRFFSAEEEKPGGPPVVILSHRLWQQRFAGDRGAIGQSLMVSGSPATVIGVLPADFKFPETEALEEDPALWRPLMLQQEWLQRTGSRWLQVSARLKPHVPLDEARHEMAAVAARLQKSYPATNENHGVAVLPMKEFLVGSMRTPLTLLFGAVGLVLLIGCANVSNLLLARAEARNVEFSARLALGAKRSHVMRQLLAESFWMAVLASLVALLFARWGIDTVVALYGGHLPRLNDVTLDGRVTAFTLLVSLGTVALFGLAPATAALGVDFYTSLQQGARGAISASPRRRRMRNTLVVVEVAVALALLVGAGLLLRNLRHLLDIDPGFNPKNVLTLQMILPRDQYPDDAKVRFAEQLCERAQAISGVSSCGVTSFLPLTPGTADRDYWIEGQEQPRPGDVPKAGRRLVSPGYFTAMGIPLVEGRAFSAVDRAGRPGVAIVNESLARRAWPDQSPIGKRISVERPEAGKWLTVVGVSKDVRHSNLESEPAPELYQPFAQRPWFALVLILRTSKVEPGTLVPWVRQEVLRLDPRLPVYDVQTMEQRLAGSLARQRFSLFVLGVLASVGLFLAAVGIYSVMAYIVSQRKHDLSVRMAMGAQRHEILKLVMGQGMRLVLTGIGLGLCLYFLLAVVLTRFLSALLYEVHPIDPLTVALVAVLMAAVAAVANYVPAWRATRVDPITALRS